MIDTEIETVYNDCKNIVKRYNITVIVPKQRPTQHSFHFCLTEDGPVFIDYINLLCK